MKILLNKFRFFVVALLLFVFSDNIEAQCSITEATVLSSSQTCSSFSSCPIIYIGDGVNPTSLILNSNLNLTTCSLGPIQLIVNNNANIDFSDQNYDLRLPAGSSISFNGTGTLIAPGGCSASDRIVIGGTVIANCLGSGTPLSFPELVSQGGYNIVNVSPASASICGSGSFSFTATAMPLDASIIKWYDAPSGGNLLQTGALGSSNTITQTVSATTTYYVEATIGGFTTPRKAVVATVNPLPSITTQPINQLDCEGASVNFAVVATGTGLTYSWQYKRPLDSSYTIILSNSTNIDNFNENQITIRNVGSAQFPNGTLFQVNVSNSSGCSVTSNAATLTVNEIKDVIGAISITQCFGTDYSYEVITSYPANVLKYQWKSSVASGTWNEVVNGTHFSGATSAKLEILDGTPAESAEYRVYVEFDATGANCNVDSSSRSRAITFLPEVTPPVPTITQPDCLTSTGSVVLSGLPVSGTWTLTRTGTSTATTTGTGSNTTISALTAGTYNFTVSNGTCSSLPTANIIINVQPGTPLKPSIVSYTLPTFADNDGTITLGNLPSGNWVGNQIKDGVTTTISGTGSPYTLTGLSNGSYEFEVVALCISPRSDPRSLTTVPYTPAISAATAINCTGFTANWPATPFVTAYLLDVSTDINFGSFVSGYQNRNVGNVLSFVVSGMQPGTLYYRIRAINTTLQSLYSATITVVPLINTYSAGSWSLGAPPTTVGTQNLVFNTSYNATADLAGCSCAVNSGNVIVKSGKTLSLINGLTVNLPGSLTFENSASLVQINNVTNSGNIKYYRNYTGGEYDYTFWSSPVAVQNLGVLSPSSDPDSFYSFDDASANDWVNENPSSTTMTIGKGYIIRGIPPPPPPAFPPGFDTLTFNGVPNNGFYSITGIIADNSYLLGNPYPSALDADAFLVANSGVLNGTLYFWTHNTPIAIGTSSPGSGLYAYSGDDYATYNATGGVGAAQPDIDPITGQPYPGQAPSGGSIPTGKIASGQGFFASTKLSLSGTAIVYNNTMRVGVGSITGDNSQFYKTKNPKAKKTAQLEKHRVWLDLTNDEGAFKQTLVGYITDATNTYDDRFDGESFDGNDFLDFYSINSEKHLTIQGRGLPFDQNDEVPLGFRVAVGGNFTLKIGQKDGLLSNQEIFIEDKLINKVVNLKEGDYTFTTTAGTFDDRFKLKYTNQTLGVEEVETNDGIIALYSNNYKTLIIRNNLKDTTVNSVMLFNLAGQKIANWDVKGREQTSIQIPIKNLSSEIYIVKIETTQGEFSKKIIVK